jgi:colanic acid biosynthesis glycosyl transferase WcaI
VKVIAGTPHYPEWEAREGYKEGRRRDDLDGAQVVHLPHYVPSKPRLPHRLLMELHFGIKAACTNWEAPDVVLFVSPALISTAVVAVAASIRYRKARTAVWVQDFYGRGLEESHASASRFSSLVQRLEGSVLARAHATFVIHDRFRQHAVQRLHLAPSAIQVIRNWSHIGRRGSVPVEDVRREYGWSEKDIVVLHAGNMGVKQHLENVIEAARIAERRASPVRFVLLGGGNQRLRLEAMGANVASLQFIDPLPNDRYASALAAANILLVNEMPGVRDMSLPSKLTSYFTTGRPVLAAVEGDSATAVELNASKSGIVVPSGDPEALLQAAESIGADPVRAEQLGANGPLYAKENLSTESALRRWDTALRSLLH